ncbi:MAG: efflux RND transporter periplasmic adaptor subunit [Syntrophaceae bacterium]
MNSRYKKIILGTGILLVLVMVILAFIFYLNPPDLVVQGEVEAKQVDVAAKISGRVLSLPVRKGDSVHKGQLLATLDSPEIEARVRQARSAEKAAAAQSRKAVNGAREEEIRAAFNLWQRARAGAEIADTTCRRIERLQGEGVVPQQKLDEARAEMNASRTAAEAARASYDLALKGTRSEDKAAAAALDEQAKGVLSEVNTYYRETSLFAPTNGEIDDLIVDPGELVGPGMPVASIVDLSDLWVTFNLREDLIAGIRIGDTLVASFPALGGRSIRLKIDYIRPLGDFATWKATKTSGDFDLKTFEVQARPFIPVPGLRPGMSALVDGKQFRSQGKKGFFGR